MQTDKTVSVCKVLIGVLCSGSDKLTGSRRSSVKSAKAIFIEVSKFALRFFKSGS